MAVLSSSDRSSMPGKSFAGPNRSFPVNDPTHARMAISGATRSEHAGNISPEEKAHIQAEARAKLAKWDGKGGGSPMHAERGRDPKMGAGGMDHKGNVAKMHPDHVDRLVTEAAAGMHGDKAMDHAHRAMQPPQDGSETGGGNQQAPQPQSKMSPFSDNDSDDGAGSNGPAEPEMMSKASMFGMGG